MERRTLTAHSRVLVDEVLAEHVQHPLTFHGVRIGRDDRGEVQNLLGDTGRSLRRQALEVVDERRHRNIVKRIVRHQVAHLVPVCGDAFTNCACEGGIGVGIAIAAHALQIRQVKTTGRSGARTIQVRAGDRRNEAAAFLGPESTAAMAVDAGRLCSLRHQTRFALGAQGFTGRQYSVAIDSLPGPERVGFRGSVNREREQRRGQREACRRHEANHWEASSVRYSRSRSSGVANPSIRRQAAPGAARSSVTGV